MIVLWIAGFQSAGLDSVYSSIKQEVAVQEAQKRLVPEESNLAFLVEDIVNGWAGDSQLLERIGDFACSGVYATTWGQFAWHCMGRDGWKHRGLSYEAMHEAAQSFAWPKLVGAGR